MAIRKTKAKTAQRKRTAKPAGKKPGRIHEGAHTGKVADAKQRTGPHPASSVEANAYYQASSQNPPPGYQDQADTTAQPGTAPQSGTAGYAPGTTPTAHNTGGPPGVVMSNGLMASANPVSRYNRIASVISPQQGGQRP